MPQPTTGKINIRVSASDLLQRPEHATLLAIIAAHWAEIEDELALIFAYVAGTIPALAASVLGKVNNLNTRLEMVQTAIEVGIGTAAAARFERELRPAIRKRAGERSKIVHSQWAVHEEYPDAIIRTNGLSDPQITMEVYDLKDLAEIEKRLLDVQLALKSFAQYLQSCERSTLPGTDFWHPTPSEDQA